jgi:hypothetical protein
MDVLARGRARALAARTRAPPLPHHPPPSFGQGYTEPLGLGLTASMLEDVADAVGGDDCGDVLAWLAAHEGALRAAREMKTPLVGGRRLGGLGGAQRGHRGGPLLQYSPLSALNHARVPGRATLPPHPHLTLPPPP